MNHLLYNTRLHTREEIVQDLWLLDVLPHFQFQGSLLRLVQDIEKVVHYLCSGQQLQGSKLKKNCMMKKQKAGIVDVGL